MYVYREESESKKAKTDRAVTNGGGDSSQASTVPSSSMESSGSYGYNQSWPGYSVSRWHGQISVFCTGAVLVVYLLIVCCDHTILWSCIYI